MALPFLVRPRSSTRSCLQMRCTCWILGGNTGMYSPPCPGRLPQLRHPGLPKSRPQLPFLGVNPLSENGEPWWNEPEHCSHLRTRGPLHSGKHTEAKMVGLPVQQLCVNQETPLLAQVKCSWSPHIMTQSERPCLAALPGPTGAARTFSPTHTHPGHGPHTTSSRHSPRTAQTR